MYRKIWFEVFFIILPNILLNNVKDIDRWHRIIMVILQNNISLELNARQPDKSRLNMSNMSIF